ncbi:MAG: hypothetical protein O4861_07600 [Trichodesmium sp. St16_bin4-tuft]|uniref:Phosphoribosyl-AMP cyclohydrolase n=1 Tax=Trichodesmium erythraeum (strain IMS101) TaxID=203124 RepID=Q110I9_TRIEI|nr:hypothetical protein [Trichodesmium erythraeum GBRTRLIN201]MCH2049709.1 hypothetical protein [Trichodesmium sp. ALOHA_ZT_67]MCL2929790.1 hypothetical protein [Trichodesmium sp. MAG_R01]MDE5068735.1 hypothetical protein [Trichodesmium sp. St4_bin8_1]MDE5072935.1 hypothetical protein [Trichodesmium sp. St5_bin8]MDE5076742.1 hypothetical protein [Trichodesmium sp. St2_bin6]MDE5092328.1 hypothetical protein [Trichodesmium sp. St18_bin3_1_1]MDE5098204.1 hypothetical protein [Trichodesmium sp. 
MIKGVLGSILAWVFLMSSPAIAQPITEAEVEEAQKVWAQGIVAIGAAYLNNGDYKKLAENHVDTLYGYDEGAVLFKPTKASADQFRLTEDEAVSYFVGGIVQEDTGFALQPWMAVRFENADIITDSDSAVAMGNYYFKDVKTQKEVKVEYTFGYIRGEDGKLLINVHHSALPYKPTK